MASASWPTMVGRSALLWLAIWLGCGDDGAQGESSATTSSPTSTTTEAGPATDSGDGDTLASTTGDCPVGEPDCPCRPAGGCDPGLVCVDDSCVVGMAECGNGEREGAEECDLGPDNGDQQGCKTDCTLASCGDGFLGPGEVCDDGNLIPHDACTNACVPAACGDGVLHDGEACDDGNASNDDACLDGCVLATCGDGFTWVGVEQCDDANLDDQDACLNDCVIAVCGDGVRHDGVEECDGAALGGATCASLGAGFGVLTCTAACTYDTSGCAS